MYFVSSIKRIKVPFRVLQWIKLTLLKPINVLVCLLQGIELSFVPSSAHGTSDSMLFSYAFNLLLCLLSWFTLFLSSMGQSSSLTPQRDKVIRSSPSIVQVTHSSHPMLKIKPRYTSPLIVLVTHMFPLVNEVTHLSPQKDDFNTKSRQTIKLFVCLLH